MARVTVEDCLPNVENLFQLVLLACRACAPPRQWGRAHGAGGQRQGDGDRAARDRRKATSPPRCWPSRSRCPSRWSTTSTRSSRTSAPRSSAWWGNKPPARMDIAQSLLGLIPGTSARRTPASLTCSARPSCISPEQVDRIRAGRRVRRRGPPGPEAPLRRSLHLPPGGRRRDPRRPAPRRRHDCRRHPARRHRRHAGRQGRDREALRQGRGRDRRRRHQARPDQVQEPRGSAGRILPQDAARDGARPARHHGQARRPHAQHAHAGCHVRADAPADRARDAGHLRARGRAPRPVQDQAGAGGPRLPGACTRSATA